MFGSLIFDTSAVFNFGHRSLGCGETEIVLKQLQSECDLLIPPEVEQEALVKPLPHFPYKPFIDQYFTVCSGTIPPVHQQTFLHLSRRMGAELAVFALALAKDGTAVLDDKPARQQAETINVKYTGTVGLLNTSVQKGWISGTSALTVVTVIVQNGGRLPKPNGSTDWDQYLNSIA